MVEPDREDAGSDQDAADLGVGDQLDEAPGAPSVRVMSESDEPCSGRYEYEADEQHLRSLQPTEQVIHVLRIMIPEHVFEVTGFGARETSTLPGVPELECSCSMRSVGPPTAGEAGHGRQAD